jgi:hypothetical protein
LDVDALLHGVVDLYVHCEPDLLARRGGDIALAGQCRDAGYAAALHRHHFSSTVERAAVAREATGFALVGGVLLHDSVGGVNPWAAERALRLGGRWLGLPTLSARFFREGLAAMPADLRTTLAFGPGALTLVADEGVLSGAAAEVVRLAREWDVPLNLGYVSEAECAAVIDAARRIGHAKLVMTNPHTSMRQLLDTVAAFAAPGGVFVELNAYSMHPDGPGKRDPGPSLDKAVAVLRRVGVERCVLSSDGGMADAPPPHELLSFALRELHARGVTERELIRLVQDNPARLLGLQ